MRCAARHDTGTFRCGEVRPVQKMLERTVSEASGQRSDGDVRESMSMLPCAICDVCIVIWVWECRNYVPCRCTFGSTSYAYVCV